MRRWLVGLVVLLWAVPAQAATRNVAGCTQALVQAEVDAAATGDTVLLQASCTATWSVAVAIPNTKGLTLNGNGSTITVGAAPSLTVAQNATTGTRVTGFTFSGNTSSVWSIRVSGSSSSSAARIDHNTFSGGYNAYAIEVGGNAVVLIDNNTFNYGGGSETIHDMGMGPGSDAGWTDDITPGGASMVFVEDNTFTTTTWTESTPWVASAIQCYYGSRTVFRHNTLNFMIVDAHGTNGATNRGARWWEVYSNTFNLASSGMNQYAYPHLRGGSGIVYDNHKTGYTNVGSGSILLQEEQLPACSYPCLDQIGRGKNQALDPAYIWGNDANDSTMQISLDPAALIQANRDYYTSAKPGWTAYTYPHPLQGVAPPNAPTNVRIR